MRRELKEPPGSRLVLALTWQPAQGEAGMPDLGSLDAVLAAGAGSLFGEIGLRGPVFDFTHTSYYGPEMGLGLKKCFIEIEGARPRSSLPSHKTTAVRLEAGHLDATGGRRLNVDPMLVSVENVVIATSKNFPHRIYLGEGVYGDLALMRRKSGYEPLPWTYPDFIENLLFFEKVYKNLRP